VLTVTGLRNAEYLISSVALSVDEYYAGVGESPGLWAGGWAEALGLVGVVEAEQLRDLVDGKHPESGVDLLAGCRPRSVLAFDLTFSAPKSVSLLWALGTEPTADVIAAAHREAVAVALGFLEERAAVARVQSQGVRRRVATGGWVVAGFVHRTSREGDPQLHTHCLVPNLVRREDGRHVAFDAAPLFEWGRAAGSIYQNHLQRTLSERLGVAWGPDHHNTREMKGFTKEQLRAFSKRSVQIEAELEKSGAVYESPTLRMRADDQASLATRTGKDHALTPSRLAGRWQQEAEEAGLAWGDDLDRSVRRSDPTQRVLTWEEITEVLVDPEVGVCSRSARFTKADVIEQLCAISGGRLSVEEIAALADRFVNSDLAVRLTPDTETGRPRPAYWSTAAHRALEDRTLALMETLMSRPPPTIDGEAVTAALEAAPELGEDQVAAVRALGGDGGSLRAVLSPAGYGKTTMLHTAARAAVAAGRPVVAVATTAKAVAEMAGAGLDAKTIARLRIELGNGPLEAGTVLVLDEISQTPTAQVEAVLAAVDACPGGSIWVLGDPRQSQPVGPGGSADHIDALATAGRIPSARLSVNRRQVDPADREALDLLRRGEPAASQELRKESGWEHELATPAQTREAMADAVCDDIANHGDDKVAALVVSHPDAEDLADRIRVRLADSEALSGPSMSGPGWAGEREYRAGDRVLLHARCGGVGSLLVNGTTATVTGVGPDGLTVRLGRSSDDGALLPAEFVAGSRKDGTPNLSHAWARTIDGAQGGTWETCHLLGSSALDAYRGYTGQSRSRQPTHTWNTARVAVVDHGGILADRRDPAEQVAVALGRQPDPSLAARSDPWFLDRELRDRIAEHERVLSHAQPEAAESWRRDEIASLREQLDHHWAQVAVACVSADDPLAYGIERLRHARTIIARKRRDIDAGTPDDRADQWQQAHRQLPDRVRDREQAQELLKAGQAQLEQASRRRWGRHDHQAIANAQAQVAVAQRRVEQATALERDLRERLAALAEHQRSRLQHIADQAPNRKRLDTALGQIAASLDRTLPNRVAALADHAPEHLVARIGAAPTSGAGRAVWCHHALAIEAFLDQTDGRFPNGTLRSLRTERARQQILLADRLLKNGPERDVPAEWANLTQQASAILDQVRRAERSRANRQPTAGQSPETDVAPWSGPAFEPWRPTGPTL